MKKDYPLVLAGGKGWKYESIMETLAELKNRGEHIIQTGYVPDDDLPAVYSGASLFIFPSFYEGFGIPPLEAMACGVPTIVADNTSLPEVVGDAAIRVKAEDTPAITSTMAKLIGDSHLSDELRKKGLARAQKFNWQDSAEKLIKLLEDL